MKIIVVGAGVVGEELCSELSRENEIILIEKNIEKLDRIIEKYDVTGLVGNGASYENLLEAGANKSDIFISVTESDEVNIMSCIIAKKMGANYTIARVRNPEYSQNIKFVREELGISFMINPEAEAAKSIVNKLRFPNALSADSYFSNSANIIELVIKPESILVGTALKDIEKILKDKIVVCVVKRGEKVLIPMGDFVLQENDSIYVTGSSEAVMKFYNKMGYKTKGINSVLVIGGGIISHYLAEKLVKSKKSVKIIDSSEKRVEALSNRYGNEVIVVKGSEVDQEFLLGEGIGQYDAVVVITDNDEENIVISMFAKSVNSGKILTKMNSTMLMSILNEQEFSSIVPKKIISEIILRVVRSKIAVKSSKMNALRRLYNTNAEAIIFEIGDKSKALGIPLKDLKTKPNLLIGCILRNNEELIYPGGNDVIKCGDRVVVVTLTSNMEEFDDILA